MLDGEILHYILDIVLLVCINSEPACLLARCDPADQGGLRSSVLQPHELQLPAPLCVPLEEPASVLHDGGGG